MKQMTLARALCCIMALFVSLTSATAKTKQSLRKHRIDGEQKRCPDVAIYNSNVAVKLSPQSLWQTQANVHVVFVNHELVPLNTAQALENIEESMQEQIITILKRVHFEGKVGQTYLYTPTDEGRSHCLFVGLGELHHTGERNLELFRRAIGHAVKEAKKLQANNVALALPDASFFDINTQNLIHHATCAYHLAYYSFDTFKSNNEDAKNNPCVVWLTGLEKTDENNTAVEFGNILGNATNMARHWGDLPANILTPSEFATEAKRLAEKYDFSCTILEEEDAEELKMGGFLAVTSGSQQDGKFVILEYDSGLENAPTIALCGKGVTFDTGGVSLKPATGMTDMKYDMCGAAAVIATMSVIAQLKPAVNVVGITPMVENMPDGNAARQDDIIRAMNGKSIEVKNTDAEGRLILSDALCYAESFYQPDVIIDIATLTGACKHALGHFYAGLVSNDKNLTNQLVTSGQRSGDRVWQMPFDEDYKQANKSSVADVANTPSNTYLAGCISGGCFLSEFIRDTKWAHIDTSGTAKRVPGINYLGEGGTGAGVRLLTDFIMNYKI
ncbi:MAG: leucyl aminopeptidase [Epsilonproteobacteria bacterium]|nr:leucyl aminopeptidase [Campylobacterota bacterium]